MPSCLCGKSRLDLFENKQVVGQFRQAAVDGYIPAWTSEDLQDVIPDEHIRIDLWMNWFQFLYRFNKNRYRFLGVGRMLPARISASVLILPTKQWVRGRKKQVAFTPRSKTLNISKCSLSQTLLLRRSMIWQNRWPQQRVNRKPIWSSTETFIPRLSYIYGGPTIIYLKFGCQKTIG